MYKTLDIRNVNFGKLFDIERKAIGVPDNYITKLSSGVIRNVSPMQANKLLKDTEFHNAFIVNGDSDGYLFGDDDRPELALRAFFMATAAFLSKVKVSKTDEASALVLMDIAGGFMFGAIVEYHENENPDEPGNWSLVMTFNEDDVKSLERKKKVKKYLYTSMEFKTVFDVVCYDVSSIKFEHQDYMYEACMLLINTIKQILDREAKVGEVVEVEAEGCFTASVSVEGDEKIFAITPAGYLKEIIKDDAVLER